VVFAGLSAGLVSHATEPLLLDGETIRYAIKQGPLKVGEATLSYEGETDLKGQKAVLITFTSKGPAFFDNEKIYVDPVTFRPIKVFRDLKIFGGREKITEDYTASGKIRITKDVDGKITETLLEKEGPVDNIYGFIYRYRLQSDPDLKAKFDVRLPTVDLVMRVASQAKFKAGGKTYDAVQMKSVPDNYTIWIGKGAQRLPLRIGGAIGIANTVMILIGVEYLPAIDYSGAAGGR